jgi:hypothetical protein
MKITKKKTIKLLYEKYKDTNQSFEDFTRANCNYFFEDVYEYLKTGLICLSNSFQYQAIVQKAGCYIKRSNEMD